MMLLSTRRLFFLILLLVLFTLTTREVTDPDFWWHLKAGQHIFETRTIPHTDIFSFTFAGREWVAHEWLSEVLIYALFKWSGWAGLVIAFALMVTAAFAISYLYCGRRAALPFVSWGAGLLGAVATAPVWGVRPQMFSLLLASIFIAILYDYLRRTKGVALVLLLPPLMLLWVNLHGGYVLGLVLITISLCGLVLDSFFEKKPTGEMWRRAWPLALMLVACVLVVPLNPNGVRMFSYPFETLFSSVMQEHIEEWFSPDFHQSRFLPLVVLMFSTFVALAVSPRRARMSELLMLCATGYAVLRSGRHLPIFAFAAVPLLAEHASLWIKSRSRSLNSGVTEKALPLRQSMLRVALLLVALGIGMMNVRQVVARQAQTEAQRFPASAVEFIRAENPPGPIFNWYDWGGYLIWKLYPERLVYIDGRADVYGDAFIKEFLQASKGEGDWREPLSRYNVRTVIIKPDSPLSHLLQREEGWSKAFEDKQAVVLIKR